ncbi:MAG: hypothetical protein LBV69_00045 [Bacteroidales bacterium]|jgi:hypothetical protein|nr:hypothetical protein [Bacteroidales bacterium]
MKTAGEIENFILGLVVESEMTASLNGSCYRAGLRPKNSKLEDVEINFITSNAEQIQTGVVQISIFIPQVFQKDGTSRKNIARCDEIEQLAVQFTDTLITANTSDFLLTNFQTIQTIELQEIQQNIVIIKLKFKTI